MEWGIGARPSHRLPQRIDLGDEQAAASVEQVHREK